MSAPRAERPPESRRQQDLDCRYARIGISAVAAALRAGSEDNESEPKNGSESEPKRDGDVTHGDRAA